MNLVDDVARGLLVPTALIRGLAQKASYAYKAYEIPKRRGGTRTIHQPSRELKALQRWLLRNLVTKWRVHDAAFAYRNGRSVYDHAKAHATSSYLLRLDLVNFFPSITNNDVRAYLMTVPPGTEGWGDDDRDLFTAIVCRDGRLTIGAPTSPALSNALCWDLDIHLCQVSENLGVRYTRYADDLFFSTYLPDVLGGLPDETDQILKNLAYPRGLIRNERKTHHSSKKGHRSVTGVVLASDGRAVLGRKRKRKIRALVDRFESLSDDEQQRLRGLIAYASSIEPDLINALVLKYGSRRVTSVLGS